MGVIYCKNCFLICFLCFKAALHKKAFDNNLSSKRPWLSRRLSFLETYGFGLRWRIQNGCGHGQASKEKCMPSSCVGIFPSVQDIMRFCLARTPRVYTDDIGKCYRTVRPYHLETVSSRWKKWVLRHSACLHGEHFCMSKEVSKHICLRLQWLSNTAIGCLVPALDRMIPRRWHVLKMVRLHAMPHAQMSQWLKACTVEVSSPFQIQWQCFSCTVRQMWGHGPCKFIHVRNEWYSWMNPAVSLAWLQKTLPLCSHSQSIINW